MRKLLNTLFPVLVLGAVLLLAQSTFVDNIVLRGTNTITGSLDCTGGTCTGFGGASAIGGPFWPMGRSMRAGTTAALAAANEVDVWGFTVDAPGRTVTSVNVLDAWYLATSAHIAWAVYDSTGTLVINSTTTTSSALTGDAPASVAWGATFTLTPGFYYLAFTSDVTAARIYQISDMNGGTILAQMDNIGSNKLYGKCANGSTGTTTLVFNASCGAITGRNEDPPYVVIWK